MYKEMVTRLKLFTNEELTQLKIALQNEIGEREAKLQNKALEELTMVLDKYKELGVVFFVLDNSKIKHPIYLDNCIIHTGNLYTTEEYINKSFSW
jgi:hypothetical protein